MKIDLISRDADLAMLEISGCVELQKEVGYQAIYLHTDKEKKSYLVLGKQI